MKLSSLKPKAGAVRSSRRVGRGQGSGRGTFSGRGCKGQGQHGGKNPRPGFEGGQTPLMRRLPKLAGFRNPNSKIYQVVNVADLNRFEEGAEVTVESLLTKKLIRKKHIPVKVLGDGKVTKKLTLKVHALSFSAKNKILQAGGKIL